ncbi:MAG: Biotin carboxyl carrier protein of acetyl-CoA carboxylase [Alphaproteobacteria bacterium MarineAlpha5_Bin6]|nr:MAG: Biotin carboxyl carrier protein of acetyl-CoA carboxylase [Alphaproteobacteria bacterium MarineAlpha5_Bin7]PPR53950.1 MAG: Biotin carboxyl carrier protein of acetyl-CoA carboxylase [Alphaproteobacteria bacterium MarineAlpha5_Bin6]|tara:strand:- start:7983 stop:8429 length:447 start_codon:yes stop_codon:yes gene_type:complete
MTKIDKIDIENINLLQKELKLKNINKIKIKKKDYEVEISTGDINSETQKNKHKKIESSPESDTQIKEQIKSENIINSPMVGVAYLSPDPASQPYIKEGQHVKQGDILLLIEAMKTFNEIKAPKSGVIKKIIVLNSQPVEFGDDLVIFE